MKTIQNAVSAFSQLFRRNKKLNFFFESGSFVSKILNSVIEYDKKWYPRMHLIFHALCYPPIWWNFSAVPAFCPYLYWVSVHIWHFVFVIFFSSRWSVKTGVLTKYSRENRLPYHFRTRCIWLIMIGDKRHFGCRYGISDHFGPCFIYGILSFYQLWPGFW